MNVQGTERRETGEPGLTTADMAGTADRSAAERQGQVAAPEAGGTQRMTAGSPAQPGGTPSAPLFVEQEAQRFRTRWQEIQTAFVDDPRQAVEQADHLVAETMKRLAEMFAKERDQLEQQWSRGDNVSTEDLRIALQRYRSFFDRLLSV